MGAFWTMTEKVAVILVLIVVGYVVSRIGMLTQKGLGEITTFLLRIVTPCLIVDSFLGAEAGRLDGWDVLWAALLPTAAIGICIAASYLFFRKEPPDRRKVLRFAMIFSNTGFMGMPLIESMLGAEGVLYGSFFIAVFNLFCWTYGYIMMGGGRIRVKTLLLNPGLIGLAVGLPVYFLRIPVPDIAASPVGMLAALNTPLAMMVVGGYIARVKPRAFFSDIAVYKTAALRLLLCPLLFLPLALLVRPDPVLSVSSVIQASMPVAANCVLFAVEFGGDAELASKNVAVSTVLSILTTPLLTALVEALL